MRDSYVLNYGGELCNLYFNLLQLLANKIDELLTELLTCRMEIHVQLKVESVQLGILFETAQTLV